MTRLSLHGAATEAAEARSWQCDWCPTFVEDHRDGEKLCDRCAGYVADLEARLFEFPWDSNNA